MIPHMTATISYLTQPVTNDSHGTGILPDKKVDLPPTKAMVQTNSKPPANELPTVIQQLLSVIIQPKKKHLGKGW
jgi:hypothetical protein